MPCSPAVPVLLTAGDWILTSMAVPYEKEPAWQALHRSKGKSWVHTLYRGNRQKEKVKKEKKSTNYLWIFLSMG